MSAILMWLRRGNEVARTPPLVELIRVIIRGKVHKKTFDGKVWNISLMDWIKIKLCMTLYFMAMTFNTLSRQIQLKLNFLTIKRKSFKGKLVFYFWKNVVWKLPSAASGRNINLKHNKGSIIFFYMTGIHH